MGRLIEGKKNFHLLISRIKLLLARHLPGDKLHISFHRARGVKIGKGVGMDEDVYIDSLYPELVSIGERTQICSYTAICTHWPDVNQLKPGQYPTDAPLLVKPVRIGKGVWIGAHSTILPGVTIGDGAVIVAGSVVIEDVPAFTTVAGVPAKPFRQLFENQ